jgi:hypothetical protein
MSPSARCSRARWSPSGARRPPAAAEKDEDKCWCEPGRNGKCWQKSTRDDDTTPFPRRPEGRPARRPSHPEGWRGLDRRPGGHPARLFQHRLLLRAVLGQSLHRHAPARPGAARLRPDAVQHRPVPARLPELPGRRGPPAEPARLLRLGRIRRDRPARRPRQPAQGQANPAAAYTAAPSWSPISTRNSARVPSAVASGLRRQLRALPFEHPGKRRRPFKNRDFAAPNEAHPRKVRADFLGNDQPTPVTEVGTFRCRALHSNHKAGHLYMEYAPRRCASSRVVADIPERGELKDGGRGYMRNISLVNVWATAPFMHNNAIGPEICGKPANKDNDFHRARYVDADGKLLPASPTACATTRGGGPLRALQALDARTAEPQGARPQAHADQRRPAHRRRHPPARGQDREAAGRLRPGEDPDGRQRRLPQRPAAQATGRRPLPRQARPGKLEAAGKKALVPPCRAWPTTS